MQEKWIKLNLYPFYKKTGKSYPVSFGTGYQAYGVYRYNDAKETVIPLESKKVFSFKELHVIKNN